MALLPIIIAPDPRLKVTAKPVKNVDESVRRLMDDMLETMHAANGIGLAAPQAGDKRRRSKWPTRNYCGFPTKC